TDYGNRSLSEVKADVDLYDQHFDIHGIFFDQAASSASKVDDYQELYDYVKSRANLDKVIINPGTHTDEGYVSRPASDVAVIFANDSSQWPNYQPDAYVATYPANRFAMLAHGVPDVATMQSHIDLAKERNIGYVYLTDGTFSRNRRVAIPTFWSEEVAYIEKTNSTSN
ncbi:MAG: spherulation-specific family 4 protein, partial [Ardenticatenaceae bacterium]